LFQTTSGIEDEELAEARELIGEKIRLPEPFNTIATRESIKHFAYGCGDDNPLWCNKNYAREHGYDRIMAPPTYLYSVFPAGVCPAFPGLQGFHAGSRWEFASPVLEDEEIDVSAELEDIKDVMGKRSGRTLIMCGRTEYRGNDGQLLAVNLSKTFRKPRPGSPGGLKMERPPFQPSEAEIEQIENEIVSYRRRGAEPRYGDDVTVGEAMPRRLKGPLVVEDIIAFTMGIGNVVSGEIAVKNRHRYRQHPELAPTHRPLGWLLERVPPAAGHMNPDVAKAVGMPAVYDNGWLRMCWMAQFVTDWMGDAGRLRVLDARLRLPNIVGDLLKITGEVTAVTPGESTTRVELSIRAHRQDDELSCHGTATVELPNR
jgi:acyl dehydratase